MSQILKLFFPIFFLLVCVSIYEDKKTILKKGEGFLTVNSSEVYYKIIGKGQPIIIIHGSPVMYHSYLLSHFDFLAKDYKLFFYNQRT